MHEDNQRHSRTAVSAPPYVHWSSLYAKTTPLALADAVVVMGVTSCGKTKIGEALAAHFGVPLTEGDKLHSAANIAKMTTRAPLTGDDRWPWLAQAGTSLRGDAGQVVSCSALKRIYRKTIAGAAKQTVRFVYLHGSREVLQQRISARKGRFMPPSLLDSQLATLEMPGQDEDALTNNIDQPPGAILKAAIAFLETATPDMSGPGCGDPGRPGA